MTDTPSASQFDDFVRAVLESPIDRKMDEGAQGSWRPLNRTLQLWADVHGFVDVAQNTKKLSKVLLDPATRNYRPDRAITLLSSYANVFRGEDQGVLGEDIMGPALRHSEVDVRWAAVRALERWAEDRYRFLEILADHQEREGNSEISEYIDHVLETTGYWEGEDVGMECPDCGEGPCVSEHGCWVCQTCAAAGSLESLRRRDEDEDDEDCGPRPELEQWQELADAATNHMHSAICTSQVPGVLEGVLGIHPMLTLDFIESFKIGHLSTRATNLNLFLGPYVEEGSGKSLYFWSDTYAGSLRKLTTTDTEAPERWALDLQWK